MFSLRSRCFALWRRWSWCCDLTHTETATYLLMLVSAALVAATSLLLLSLSPSGRERVKEFGGIYLMSCTRRKGDKYYFPYQSRSPRCASSLGSLRKVSFLATETIPSPQASARGRVIFSA